MIKVRSLLQRFPIAIYFVLAYAISWGGSFTIGGPKFLRGEPLGLQDALLMAPAVMAGPLLAGIAMTYLVDGRKGLQDLISRMLKWQVSPHWYAAALLIFPTLILGVLWALTILVSPDFAPGSLLFGVLAGLFAGFLEEIGWMGFAFPRMERKYGIWRATIYLALLHGVWHAMPGYLGEAGIFGVYWLPRFVAMWIVAMTAMRVLLVWIYSNTGSLLLAQLTHASSTGFLVIFGPEAISPAQGTLWFAVYAVILWIPASVVIMKYGKALVRQPQQNSSLLTGTNLKSQ